jgi:hypothetical protein
MPDTNITLTPSVAHASGACTITASAALFTAADIGRLVGILHKCDTPRVAATAYTAGRIFISEYNQVPRLYRVTRAGTTAAANLAGTTPNYDLAAPNELGATIEDGSCILKYLGPGRHVWGWATITGFTSSTVVSATIDPLGPFAATSASLRWRLGEFSAARGWPRAGTFHKGRLWLGGTATRPQTLWASQAGAFENFAPTEDDGTVLDTNAIALSLDDDQVNQVQWLVSGPRGLAVGVASGEFLVTPQNRNGALSPGNIGADRQGDRGSDADIAPQRVSGVVLFPQRGRRRLRQLDYDFGVDRFTTVDLTALADHIAGPGFVETAYADVPDGTWYGLRSDGLIAALTFDTEQKLRAWTLLRIGGRDAVVESIAAVPDPAGTGTDLYCAVTRTIGGSIARHIEFMRSPFRFDVDAQASGYFVDGGLTYSGPLINTVTGLAHLNGEVVRVVADGSRRDDQIVTAGTVPVTGPAASVVHVGLPYRLRIVDLPPELQTQNGTAQGQTQRISRVTLRLLDSLGGTVGGLGASSAEALNFRQVEMDLGESVPLFTGDHAVSAFGRWGSNGQVEIIHDEPLPFTLLAIIKDVTVS